MTIQLDPELEARLREVAAARGMEPNHYATAVLAEGITRDMEQQAEDPDADLTEAERAEIRAGVARGLDDSAAGRVTPAAEFYAELNRKYGVFGPEHTP